LWYFEEYFGIEMLFGSKAWMSLPFASLELTFSELTTAYESMVWRTSFPTFKIGSLDSFLMQLVLIGGRKDDPTL